MRAILTVTAFLGLAAMGAAQNGPVKMMRIAPTGPVTISADSISYDGEVRHLRGAVEIVVDGIRIKASEADVTFVTPPDPAR